MHDFISRRRLFWLGPPSSLQSSLSCVPRGVPFDPVPFLLPASCYTSSLLSSPIQLLHQGHTPMSPPLYTEHWPSSSNSSLSFDICSSMSYVFIAMHPKTTDFLHFPYFSLITLIQYKHTHTQLAICYSGLNLGFSFEDAISGPFRFDQILHFPPVTLPFSILSLRSCWDGQCLLLWTDTGFHKGRRWIHLTHPLSALLK